MCPDVKKATEVAMELEWPNHKAIIEEHFPKMEAVIFFAKDVQSSLGTLLRRLPDRLKDAPQMTFREWFFMPDADKVKLHGKTVWLVVERDPKEPGLGIPGKALFLNNSGFIDIEGVYTDFRDGTGWRWGDRNSGRTSHEVLNGYAKEAA